MKDPKFNDVSHQSVADLLSKKIGHPRINEVIEEIEALTGLGAGKILMVVGATGVGKTTLGLAIEQRILKAYQAEMQQNAGLIPVLRIEARATSESEFNWKLFYTVAIEALEGQAAIPAVLYGVDSNTNKVVKPAGRSRDSSAALRKQLENAITARGVKYLVIDEGGHFTNVSEAKMKRQTDALKSLSNCAGCQIILLGSYDTLDISRLSAQLARRTKEIHFSRYHIDRPDDCIDFKRLLNHLETQANGYFKGLLIDNAELLQKNSLGCVGTLMDLIKSFISRAEKCGHLSQAVLLKSLQTPAQCAIILQEIRRGEERFEAQHLSVPARRGAA